MQYQEVSKHKNGVLEHGTTDGGKHVYRITWKNPPPDVTPMCYVGLGMNKGAACDYALRILERGIG